MASIKVDHSKFEATAKAVDAYVKTLKTKMTSAQTEVTTLSKTWQGTDATKFKTTFNKVDDKGSVHAEMVKALESYAKYLRYAAQKYKDVQTDAVNRANRLPRW